MDIVGSPEDIDKVHAISNTMFAAPMLRGGPGLRYHLGSSWLAPIAVAAIALLVIVALVLLGNRALSLVQDDVGMLRTGLGLDDVSRVQRKELVIPALVAILLGAGCGMVLLWAGALLDFTETPFGWIFGGVLAVVGLSLVLIWFVSTIAMAEREIEE
ncbi:hypothetical protein [Yimella sp. cx-51]|uniref:hypothetical protein n=1 Tax=Yimella sp. cx-51 TaxID=2770551 RepID=UPI00165D70B4|nr:hypothetical protein [Yimella sp. cx-51]MBC9957724.1 hypothetical protein [Yimella sp. cx-51]QTH36926.1 hypothetical protein J5M86_08235 [Yimella sp. cx-51]